MNVINTRRAGRLPAQMIIAIVIAIIAIVGYVSKRSINPVTKEAQYVAMSEKQEIALGLEAAPQMAQQMGGVLGRSDPRAALVKEVGDHIVKSSDAGKPESPYARNFDFHLLADADTVNAFALPGGQIFITRGLYDRLENEAQLAGVLGHEIGHVINRHSSEHMAKGQLGGMLATAVGVGASDDRGGGYGAAVIAQVVNQVAQTKFSRKDELESDSYGLRYMMQAGYDPRSMVKVMEVLKEASGGRGGISLFQTHPNPDQRIVDIKAWLAKTFADGMPKELSQGRPLR